MITKKGKTIREKLVEAIWEGFEEVTLLNTLSYKVFYVGDIGFFERNSTSETLDQRIVGAETIGDMLYIFF